MSKNTEIKFVGQPIFRQVIKLMNAISIQGLVEKHHSDHYYKAFKAKTHLITMLFGILSRCDSMTEICESMRALGGKLNHLSLEKAPAKRTACVNETIDFLRMFISVWFVNMTFCKLRRTGY